MTRSSGGFALAHRDARALLVGCGQYESDRLTDIASVDRSLHAFAETLHTRCHMDASQITVLDHRNSLTDIGYQLAQILDDEPSIFLFYYVGHGLTTNMGELYLALGTSDGRADRLPYDAFGYQHLRNQINRSAVRQSIVVLDACWSGLAVDLLGNQSGQLEGQRTAITGACVFTASSQNEQALAPAGSDLTAFTGEIINYLTDGDPLEGEFLTLHSLVLGVKRAARQRGMPVPLDRTTGVELGGVRLTENRGRSAPDPLGDSSGEERPLVGRRTVLAAAATTLAAGVGVPLWLSRTGAEPAPQPPPPAREFTVAPTHRVALSGFAGAILPLADDRVLVPVVDVDRQRSWVSMIDLRAGEVRRDLPVVEGTIDPPPLTVGADVLRLYYFDAAAALVRVVDLRTGSQVAQVPTSSAQVLAIAPDPLNGEWLLVGGSAAGMELVVADTLEKREDFSVPGNVKRGIAVDSTAQTAYLSGSSQGESSVSTIDFVGRGVVSVIPLGDDAYVFDVDLLSDEKTLIASSFGENSALLVDLPSNSVRTRIPLRSGAWSMSLDRRDDRAYFSGQGGISVVDARAGTEIGFSRSPLECREIAVAPDQGAVYYSVGNDLLRADLPAF